MDKLINSYNISEIDFTQNKLILLICTWANWKPLGKKTQVFTNNNIEDFLILVNQAETLIGFNSRFFDDWILHSYGAKKVTDFDLRLEVLGKMMSPELKTEYIELEIYNEWYKNNSFMTDYSVEILAKANFKCSSFLSEQELYSLWNKGKRETVIKYCLTQLKYLKILKYLFDHKRLYDPFYGRVVGHRFIIPVPTKTLYQKIVAFGLGAFFRLDGDYAFLSRYTDYEHYALLCCAQDD